MSTPSVHDVAKSAGVSVGTVSNVLNHPHKVSPGTVERVQRAIETLGFIRNDAARQLRVGRSQTLGLIVLDVRNPFFTDIARGAEDKAAESGLTVTLGNSDESTERETKYLELFEQQRVYGVLISPYGDVTERLETMRKRGIPAVLVDRESPDSAFSSVSVDDVVGGSLAAEHLLAIGKRRLAFVGGPMAIRQVSDRLAGAQKVVTTVSDASIEVIETDALSVIAGRAAGAAIIARAPQDRPDAIFAANDLVAVGVLQALLMSGVAQPPVRVPEDIALIGYDDIDFASATVVPLSSIRQPSTHMGHTAVELLLAEAANPEAERQKVVFSPQLVIRESTALRR